MTDQERREQRERWTAKKLELVAERVFPPWTSRELENAQAGKNPKIRFWNWRLISIPPCAFGFVLSDAGQYFKVPSVLLDPDHHP